MIRTVMKSIELQDKLDAARAAVIVARDAWIKANGTYKTWIEWCVEYDLCRAAEQEAQP